MFGASSFNVVDCSVTLTLSPTVVTAEELRQSLAAGPFLQSYVTCLGSELAQRHWKLHGINVRH